MKTHLIYVRLVLFANLVCFSFCATQADESTRSSLITRSLLVTSPKTCLSKAECDEGQYCALGGPNYSHTCQRELDEGETCQNAWDKCKDHLHCQIVDDDSSKANTCARKEGIGAPCDRSGRNRCETGTICRASDSRCAVPGKVGAACDTDKECLQKRGLYCDAITLRCKHKEHRGAPCFSNLDYNNCDGFCATGGKHTDTGTCTPTQLEGARCRKDMHCTNTIFPSEHTPQLLCNVPRGAEGICLFETNLLRHLGQRCNPEADACDGRRGLSCRWAPTLHRFACQQKADEWDENVERYCTPGSPLSVCKVISGERRTCRTYKKTFPYDVVYDNFFKCFPPVITVPPGAVCNWDSGVICKPGYTCARVTGLHTPGGFHPPPVPHFCVRLGRRGARCGSFSKRCGSGLTCVGGRCMPGSDPPEVWGNWTYASFFADCSTLPCVPSAVCENDTESDKRTCMFPKQIMHLDQPCRETPQFRRECAAGLTCARNHDGRGLYICRKPAPLGAACHGENPCVSNFKCSPGWGEPLIIGRCYDPALTIPLGAPCNPHALVGERQCSVTSDGSFSLLCLPKAGSFACQFPAALFQQCDTRLNISCVGQNICNDIGVCVPPGS